MNKKQLWGAVAVSAFLIFLFMMRKPNETISITTGGGDNAGDTTIINEGDDSPSLQDQFYNAYYYTNAGIPDSTLILNGGDTAFNSGVNVTVENAALNSLHNKYIPMFGFAGVTAVGA